MKVQAEVIELLEDRALDLAMVGRKEPVFYRGPVWDLSNIIPLLLLMLWASPCIALTVAEVEAASKRSKCRRSHRGSTARRGRHGARGSRSVVICANRARG